MTTDAASRLTFCERRLTGSGRSANGAGTDSRLECGAGNFLMTIVGQTGGNVVSSPP
jgi:hypothetical protein